MNLDVFVNHYFVKQGNRLYDFKFERPEILERHIIALPVERRLIMNLSVYYPVRSLAQNRYYWGVIIIYWMEEMGIVDKDEMHDILGNELRREPYPGNPNFHRIKRTRDMTTMEFWEYCEKCRYLYIETYPNSHGIPDPYVMGYRNDRKEESCHK